MMLLLPLCLLCCGDGVLWVCQSLHVEETMRTKVKRSLENQLVTAQLFSDIQKQVLYVIIVVTIQEVHAFCD